MDNLGYAQHRKGSLQRGERARKKIIHGLKNQQKILKNSNYQEANQTESTDTQNWIRKTSNNHFDSKLTRLDKSQNTISTAQRAETGHFGTKDTPTRDRIPVRGHQDGNGEFKFSAFYIDTLNRRHDNQMREKIRNIDLLKFELTEKDREILELKSQLAQKDRDFDSLKNNCRDILEDFGDLKGLILDTVEEISGKSIEKNKQINKMEKKYERLIEQYSSEKSELMTVLNSMKHKAGIIRSHVQGMGANRKKTKKRRKSSSRVMKRKPFY